MPRNSWSLHHAIMKMTAQSDYEVVKHYCETHQIQVSEPVGKHWHKIEDATAEMINIIGKDVALRIFTLNRGIEYYF